MQPRPRRSREAISTSYLESLLKAERDEWAPEFAAHSTLNWVRALDLEISLQHGLTPDEQLAACRDHFKAQSPLKRPATAGVFGPLHHGLGNVMTLLSAASAGNDQAWTYPSHIVTSYYGSYHSMRAIHAASTGTTAPDNHAGVARAVDSGISVRLPHPLNMQATWQRNEEYDVALPDQPAAARDASTLHSTFQSERAFAQSAILAYLNGTAAWYMDRTKEKIRKDTKISNFRSADAKRLRDSRAIKRIGFVHCSFRYRGKSNYRDSFFLLHGPFDARFAGWLPRLANVTRFSWIVALAYAERHVGTQPVRDFLDDIRQGTRGLPKTPDRSEVFWTRW